MDKGGGGGGAAARKALQQGGRFLSDLFKGGPTVPLPLAGQYGQQQQQPHGGDKEDGGDALGSSERAQSHSAALERFLGHVNAAMAASAAAREAAAKRRPAHQKTLSSSSASIVSCSSTSASSDSDAQQAEEQAGQDDDDDDDIEDTTGEEAEAGGAAELRPTFRSVPMGVLQQHADASLAVVDRIAAYVDDRWRLEAKYARERGRLKLQLLQLQLQEGRAASASAIAGGGGSGGGVQYDALDGLAEALALFQEVEATQSGATVEEIDQQVRQPLLSLRAQLQAIVQEGRQEQRSVAKEVDGLEARLAKSKAGLARLRERRQELRARIEEYQRRLAARCEPDTPEPDEGVASAPAFPASTHSSSPPHSASSSAAAASFPAEAQLLPSLERRLVEVEQEARASEAEIQAQGRLLMDALGRQDRTAARWARELERADKTRRFALQAAATAYVEAEARATQRSLFQLESLMQLAARVDLGMDQQAFIARHRDGAGTAPRTPALRLLERQQEWEQMHRRQEQGRRRRQAGEGERQEEEDDDDEEGQWEEVDALPSPVQYTYGHQQQQHQQHRSSPPPAPQEEDMVTLRRSPVPPSRATSSNSAASSPERARTTRAGEEKQEEREGAVIPSFDEKEDGAVVSAFVQQLFAGPPATPPAPEPAAVPAPSPSSPRDGSFDWGRLSKALEESAPSSSSASSSFHSTAGEWRRFFERVLAGEDGRGRAAFLAELNLQRSKEMNVGAGYEELAQLLWAFLLHAQRHRDVHGAKMAMMLASTFWRVKPQQPPQQPGPAPAEKREFVSRRLVKHPLWKDSVFWTRALQDQIREQIQAMGELLPFGATTWHDTGTEARVELVARIHNTVFSNAGALAHSMLEFGASVEDAREFVLRASEQYGLPEDLEHLLLGHLARREQRHAQHLHHQQRCGQQPTPTPTPTPPPLAVEQQEKEEGEQQRHEAKQPEGDVGAQQILEMVQTAAIM